MLSLQTIVINIKSFVKMCVFLYMQMQFHERTYLIAALKCQNAVNPIKCCATIGNNLFIVHVHACRRHK